MACAVDTNTFFYEAGLLNAPRPPRPPSQSPSGPLQKMLNISNHFVVLTLSLLGYLKTRICWGGEGQFDPPHLNPMFDVQI